MNTNTTSPRLVFIVPYRDRELHLQFFRKHMKEVLEDQTDYEIYFSHQKDTRTFNRGAMKNIGFLAIKNKYPATYKTITFVFNDIDTMPFTKNFFNYATEKGTIKHFYGFHYTLGGIVSVNGEDFEKLNGFPNFWSWGYEDNELQRRAESAKIKIDRSHFYPILDKNVIHLQDGYKRIINDEEKKRYQWKTTEGIEQIKSLDYSFDGDMIQVKHFDTGRNENARYRKTEDLSKKNTSSNKRKIGMIIQNKKP